MLKVNLLNPGMTMAAFIDWEMLLHCECDRVVITLSSEINPKSSRPAEID